MTIKSCLLSSADALLPRVQILLLDETGAVLFAGFGVGLAGLASATSAAAVVAVAGGY